MLLRVKGSPIRERIAELFAGMGLTLSLRDVDEVPWWGRAGRELPRQEAESGLQQLDLGFKGVISFRTLGLPTARCETAKIPV